MAICGGAAGSDRCWAGEEQGRSGTVQRAWLVDSTPSRLRVKPSPLTWLQHCMPASAEVQAKSEFLAEEL